MARNKAPAIGGAEATLKKIDYIEEEAQNIQFAIWSNRPVSARKLLKNLSKEVDDAEGQIMDLYRALSSLERSLEELEELSGRSQCMGSNYVGPSAPKRRKLGGSRGLRRGCGSLNGKGRIREIAFYIGKTLE